MAAYLALRDKTTGSLKVGADLLSIDDELCDHLGIESDPITYAVGWMDTVGFCLAMGRNYDEVRECFKTNPDLQRVVSYLESKYDNDSYMNR